MSIFGKKEPEHLLLKQANFKEEYELITANSFVTGKENPPVTTKTVATLTVSQRIESKKILTSVNVFDIKGEASNDQMQEGLQQALILSEISPVMVFERSKKGKITALHNKGQINQDWESWKNRRLDEVIPDNPTARQRFIRNYENGLGKLEEQLPANFQYIFLLPECYEFKDYMETINDITSYKTYRSRFVPGLEIDYQLEKKNISVNSQEAKLYLQSRILENKQMEDNILSRFYSQNLPKFPMADYSFIIDSDYLFDRNTSKIIEAKFCMKEQLHEHCSYKIEMFLNAKTKPVIQPDNEQDTKKVFIPEKSANQHSWILDDDDSIIIS